MKRNIFASVLMMMLLAACSKPQPIPSPTPTPTPTPESSVVFETGTETKPVLAVEGGKIYLKFNATGAWTASVINTKADEWITLDKTKGEAGTATITVTVLQNDTPDERNATVEIKCGTSTASAVVTQKQKDALTVTAAKNEIEAAGGTFSIEVKANIEFTYQIAESCKDWLTYTETKALKTSTLNFTVAANPGTAKREGSVTIKSSLGEEVIKVYQAGEGPAIILTQNDYAVKAEGETILVEVRSNVNVEMVIPLDCDWITEEETKATSTNTFYLKISANTSYDSRTAKVAFKNIENELSEEVTITQEQDYGLFLTTSEYAVSNSEHDITVEIKANVKFEVSPEVDWIQYVETKALSTSNITLHITKNETYDKRIGTVKVKQTNGSLDGVITITQNEALGLFVTPEDISISNEAQEIEVEVNTNVDYDIIIPEDAKEMITTVMIEGGETKALAAKKIKFGISKNDDYDARETSVTFKQKNGELCGTVKVIQGQTDALLVTSAKEVTVSPDGGTFVITLKSNTKYEFSVSDEWVKEVATKGLTDYSHTFKAEAIPEGTTTRETSIIFTDTEKALSETVKIIQQRTIVFDKTEVTMICGSTEQITATVYTSDKTVAWDSSDKDVATVNADGVVSAISEGQATITATTSDGLYKASCLVAVKNIENCVVAYFAGGAYTSYNGEISYGSKLNFALKNNGNVAITVNSLQLVDGVKKTKGNVMNLSDGSISSGQQGAWTVTIGMSGISEPIAQFVYSYNGKEYVALCNMEKSLSNKEIALIILDKKEIKIEAGSQTSITAEILPNTATSSIVWSSANNAVATVSNGTVTAVSEGETIITASNVDGTIKDDCKVIIEKKSPIINFADAVVKAICVENWDTSGDGELSEKEAAAVKNIDTNLFRKNETITSFEEFQYFVGIKKISMTFQNCSSLEKIILPTSLEVIDWHSFEGCSSLKNIEIPEKVTSIELCAFAECSDLISITIPQNVNKIAVAAFLDCESLETVYIPDKIAEIPVSLFNGCKSLKTLNIPSGVTSIGASAFAGCSSLSSINIPEGVTAIDLSTFLGCSSLTSISLPAGVTSIGESAFSGCSSLIEINIPENVKVIEDQTFYKCESLKSISIPNNVESIGFAGFSDCTSLKTLSIPNSVKVLGDWAFYNCKSLESVVIHQGLTAIGQSAFASCGVLNSFTCEATTPPSAGKSFLNLGYGKKCEIYVPQSSIEQYKTADNWSKYTDWITAIE